MSALIFFSIERSVSVALKVSSLSSAEILIPSKIGFVGLFESALLTLKKASDNSSPEQFNNVIFFSFGARL